MGRLILRMVVIALSLVYVLDGTTAWSEGIASVAWEGIGRARLILGACIATAGVAWIVKGMDDVFDS